MCHIVRLVERASTRRRERWITVFHFLLMANGVAAFISARLSEDLAPARSRTTCIIANPLSPTGYSFRTLDDLGGWTQFKERPNERLEFNVAFGTDQVPASQLRPYAGAATAYYLNLARNRTYTGNVIYSPSTYLMFSLEYRHLQSSPVNDYTATGDVIGIATGYRF